jgi:hypothetical protein
MKKIKLLFVLFLGVGITFASCKKDDEEGEGDNPTPEVKTCYVVKEKADDNSYHDLIYNSDKLLTNYNGYDTEGNLVESNKLTYTDGKLSLLEVYNSSDITEKIEFTYSSSQLDSGIIYMDTLGSMTKVGYFLFTYNGDKLIKMSMFYKILGQTLEISKREIVFDGDNVSQVSYYELGGAFSLELTGTIDLEYDDKINPYLNIGINDLMGDPQYMSKNNVIKVTYKDADGNIDNKESDNIAFEYNSDNYFTKYVITSFDNTISETYTIDYECQ